MFIVIDGIDGAGKGTQTRLLVEYLESKGKKVKLLDYPRYGEKSAFMVEKYLNGEYGREVNSKMASIFYAIDRFEDFSEYKNDFESYDFIISNRYISASMIHLSGKAKDKEEKGKLLDWIYELEYGIFGIPKPDKTLFLNVSPETSIKLIQKKQKRDYIKNTNNIDIHEADTDHIQNAYNSIKDVVDYLGNAEIINCEENEEILSREIILEKILEEINKDK